MGWIFEDRPRHEGFLRGLARDIAGVLHPLGRGLPGGEDEQEADAVCVECACGWRSEPIAAPAVRYRPYDVDAHEDVEARGREIWAEHVHGVVDEVDGNQGAATRVPMR